LALLEDSLLEEEPNSAFFRSLSRSESRGQSQEKEWLAQFDAFRRLALPLAVEGGLLQLLRLLFCRERRRDIALPLAIEELGILFVDLLLLFRCRIRTGDIEGPVLHEVEIRVAAAGLAPSGKFCVAFDQRRRLGFPGRRLFRGVGAFLIIDGRTRAPPPRLGTRRRQRHAGGDRSHQQDG